MRNMDRSLGDGGMPLLAQLGLDFQRYGEGFVEAEWSPTELACNPVGGVHGGVYGVVFDAAMNFAVNSALETGDRAATLDLSYQIVRAPDADVTLTVRAEVVRAARSVAFVEAVIRSPNGDVVARGAATWSVRRKVE
jgi:uncharacterized protein (TIGR00369 family)